MRLVDLPPYAPNPNLIERFWHFTKRKVLFNKAYGRFAFFRQAFDSFFEHLDRERDAIARLITDRFHLIGHPDAGISSA